MKPFYRDLIIMARDKRISDKNFRQAIRNLGDVERRCDSFDVMLREEYVNAIYETERDRFVH